MLIARRANALRPNIPITRSTSTTTYHGRGLPPRLGPLQSQPQPTVTSEDGLRTLRLRQHGNKSLPLPPLLDPLATAARAKYTAPKLEVKQDKQTNFQKQLAANAFAQALATPVRQCHHTRARLPTHFLHPFSASVAATPTESSAASKTTSRPPITVTLVPQRRDELPPNSTLTSSTYALSTRATIEKLGRKRAWGRIVHQRMQEQYARSVGKKDAKSVDVGREWVWDPEMPAVVLKPLREVVVKELERCGRGVVRVCDLQVDERGGVGAVLVGRKRGGGFDGVGGHVPVYKLEELLGEEAYRKVCVGPPFNEGDSWAVVSTAGDGRSTMPLLLALHRLAIYVGTDSEKPKEQKS